MSTNVQALVRRAVVAVESVSESDEFPGSEHVHAVLLKMQLELEASEKPKALNAGLAHLVADSWPLGSMVSEAVAAAEQAYEAACS